MSFSCVLQGAKCFLALGRVQSWVSLVVGNEHRDFPVCLALLRVILNVGLVDIVLAISKLEGI